MRVPSLPAAKSSG